MKYKIRNSGGVEDILNLELNISIPKDSANMDYQQFLQDVRTHGVGIVEGADVETQISYVDARIAEYPPLQEQLDKIYHSGVNAWKADIKEIKDKHPKTQVAITTVADLPDWIDTIIFEKQKEEYVKAEARLDQYELSAGKKGVVRTERVWDTSTNSYVDKDVIDYVIQPLPLYINGVGRNPLIVQDEKERREARKIIDNTPQAVIDSINT